MADLTFSIEEGMLSGNDTTADEARFAALMSIDLRKTGLELLKANSTGAFDAIVEGVLAQH